ncbi:MAG TPA: acyl-CoA dehydrogenase family protein [Sandaracinaceae bacterium LLY-WYZ-13_1]|nr:acyl-CoA dehydrogenase family protein [Sandaracinaceae bacterium LLY-WYZ-13_1]
MSEAHLERAFLDDEVIEAGWRGPGATVDEGTKLEAQHEAPGEALRAMVRLLGARGVLKLIARGVDGGRFDEVSWRAVCLARERLGHASPLLELAFAMQGLGSWAISAHGDETQRARWLPKVIAGEHVAGFALTEPEAGSDLSGLATTARRDGEHYLLDGHKVLISNAPVADVFTVFAATAPPGERRRLSAFVVPASAEGLETTPTRVLGGHPIGELHLDGVRVPATDRLGEEGDGMRVALGTLHRFRPTVGAAAVGFGQRALDETLRHTRSRRQFGKPLAEQQAVQLALADMACELEAARLLVYRAAALADADAGREAEAKAGSMAKLVATEHAFTIVDRAVQLHGGRGVTADHPVARLYEDVRALRIYEGASDIQRVLVARHLMIEDAG